MRRNVVCYLMGHTGDFYDGPYHACSRCGYHAYYHEEEYDDAGHLVAIYQNIRDYLIRKYQSLLTRWHGTPDESDSDLPF